MLCPGGTFPGPGQPGRGPRQGEKVSGDTGLWFRREDGQLFLLLCDGMGSGPGPSRRAPRRPSCWKLPPGGDGRSGGGGDCILRLGPPGEAGGSTTIDLLSVDLFTGKCAVHKQGAAPTYVRRDKRIQCAVGASLPAGIVTGEQAKPDVHRFRGAQGDWIVMVDRRHPLRPG